MIVSKRQQSFRTKYARWPGDNVPGDIIFRLLMLNMSNARWR
jgi:hypothetical protein